MGSEPCCVLHTCLTHHTSKIVNKPESFQDFSSTFATSVLSAGAGSISKGDCFAFGLAFGLGGALVHRNSEGEGPGFKGRVICIQQLLYIPFFKKDVKIQISRYNSISDRLYGSRKLIEGQVSTINQSIHFSLVFWTGMDLLVFQPLSIKCFQGRFRPIKLLWEHLKFSLVSSFQAIRPQRIEFKSNGPKGKSNQRKKYSLSSRSYTE